MTVSLILVVLPSRHTVTSYDVAYVPKYLVTRFTNITLPKLIFHVRLLDNDTVSLIEVFVVVRGKWKQ